MLDVIVVGAGPVGLYTARLLEKTGLKTAVIEEDKEIGRPLKCSGLVSRNVRKFVPDIESLGVVQNEVDAAVLHSRRSMLTLRKKKAAYVIDRALFDKRMSEAVESEIILGCRAEGVSFSSSHVEIATNKGAFKAKMAAACDGPNSIFGGRRKLVKGLIAIVKEADRSREVGLFFNKRLLGDGFFWKIPRGKTIEYGAWGRDVKFPDVERFFGLKKGYEKFAGLIPVGPVRKSYGSRVLLIGGAAGQVKPWSGGGVVYGLACAEIAAKAIEKSFSANDFSEDALKNYEIVWKKKIGKQIKMGMLFRKFLERSNDFQLDLALRTGRMFNYGWMDMDFII
jgi:flavin-dependent dehydrogenase